MSDEIPKTDDSGSLGTQEQDKVTDVQVVTPTEGLPIVDTVKGLASGHSRSLGGEVAAGLIAGSFRQMEHSMNELRSENQELRNKLEASEKQLLQEKVKSAVLEERIRSFSRERRNNNLSITLGVALIGLSTNVWANELKLLAFILAVVGIVLLISGWLSPRGKSQ